MTLVQILASFRLTSVRYQLVVVNPWLTEEARTRYRAKSEAYRDAADVLEAFLEERT